MEVPVVGIDLAGALNNVATLTAGLNTMFTSLSTHWFVFLPLMFVVFGFLFSKFKSILMYRKRHRR